MNTASLYWILFFLLLVFTPLGKILFAFMGWIFLTVAICYGITLLIQKLQIATHSSSVRPRSAKSRFRRNDVEDAEFREE